MKVTKIGCSAYIGLIKFKFTWHTGYLNLFYSFISGFLFLSVKVPNQSAVNFSFGLSKASK